ncbi:MAG: hypothetical protein MUF25_18970 [Pirellulaceae bacterium]|jgi:hypothetical protein|nr:hypothetical protein [Pirellulaceae bacterium]
MSKKPSSPREQTRPEQPVREPSYAPPCVEKTQKLAEVTGATKVTGGTSPV